ncbi:MAG: Flp pilus assembly complex ATPase component TadA [Planctomycetes bacterium]|nr:Flp pilus assembly complex ATPase component TadA [Planctomycetota bacterium]
MTTDHTLAWMRFDDWLKKCVEMRASDLHLIPGYKPTARVNGQLTPIDDLVLDRSQTRWVVICLFDNNAEYQLAGSGYMHLSRKLDGSTIADITAASAGGDKSIAIRFHGGKIPSLDEAHLPPAVTTLLKAPSGLVVVAGPHGSGKTTTLYAMLDWINQNRSVHICTVEKPRHYLMQPAKALVQQREVGLDGQNAGALVAAAMHQDLDVLMVGEIEDFETLIGCMDAAETGHLVFVQMHAKDPGNAVSRLIDAAPESMQPAIRRRLSECLRGVSVQRLARRADGKGRVAIYEILAEGARKFIDGATPDKGFYLARAEDQIRAHESAGTIKKEEADTMRREFGA